MELEKVTDSGKVLLHVQNVNLGTDGIPLDVFVWHWRDTLTKDELKELAKVEFGSTIRDDDPLLQEFVNTSEVYIVWAYNE